MTQLPDSLLAEVRQFVSAKALNTWQCWYMWRYSDGNTKATEEVPNFKHINEKAISLVDNKKRKQFVEETTAVFEKRLLKYLLKNE